MRALSLRQVFIEDKFIVMHSIGSGHFGDIRVAKNVENGVFFAVKLEDATKHSAKLENEMHLYEKMKRKYLSMKESERWDETEKVETYGFPEVHHYGSFDNFNYLIMDLLGYNLETLFTSCNRRFSLKCICMIGIQMLSRLQFVHSCDIIYRDLKPENFVVGKAATNKETVIYMLDFGLAKETTDNMSINSILKGPSTKKIVGTSRYMSINAHKGKEQSRRDDLESLAYILIYFCKSSLPWQGVVSKDVQEKYQKIFTIKSSIDVATLCKGLPVQIHTFLTDIKQLKFEDKPNYGHFSGLLHELLQTQTDVCDWKFDWDGRRSLTQSSIDITTNDLFIKSDAIIHSSDYGSRWLCCGVKDSKGSNPKI